MKKIIFASALFMLVSTVSFSQQYYNQAIGIRGGGWSNGITFKTGLSKNAAFEGIVQSFNRGNILLTGLYEIHKGGFKERGFDWYYGFGGHVGVGNYGWNRYYNDNGYRGSVIGIDGILGIEYTFEEIPLNLSLDWKPSANLVGYQSFWPDEIALSIRFVIK